MYESFFGFQRRPFAAIPDPASVAPSESFQAALDELAVCVERGQGIGVLTASAGLGKTTLCSKLAEELHASFRCVLLGNSNFPTRRSLLQAVLFELGHAYNRMSEQELRLELVSAARGCHQAKTPLVLIIDEAHLLSSRLLEEIRTVTNLSEAGSPLVRVVLSGQESLEDKLAEAALDSLSQRVQCHVSLHPLTRQESMEYIAARIGTAGAEPEQVFLPESLEMISHVSDGSPRCLNQLCDHSLLLAFVAEQKPVDAETVHEALQDLKQLPLHWNEPLTATDPFARDADRERSLPASSIDATDEREPEVDLAIEAEVASIEVGCDFFERDAKPSATAAPKEDLQSRPAVTPAGDAPEVEFGTYTGPPRPAGEARESKFGVTRSEPAASNLPAVDGTLVEEVVHDRYALLDALRAQRPSDAGIVWNIAPARPRQIPPAGTATVHPEQSQPASPSERFTEPAQPPAALLDEARAIRTEAPHIAVPAMKSPHEGDFAGSAGRPQAMKADHAQQLGAMDRLELIEAAVYDALNGGDNGAEAALTQSVGIAPPLNDPSVESILQGVYEIGAMAQTLVFDSLSRFESVNGQTDLPLEPSRPSLITSRAPAPEQNVSESWQPPGVGAPLTSGTGQAPAFLPVKAHGPHSHRKYGRLFSQLRKRRNAEREQRNQSEAR